MTISKIGLGAFGFKVSFFFQRDFQTEVVGDIFFNLGRLVLTDMKQLQDEGSGPQGPLGPYVSSQMWRKNNECHKIGCVTILCLAHSWFLDWFLFIHYYWSLSAHPRCPLLVSMHHGSCCFFARNCETTNSKRLGPVDSNNFAARADQKLYNPNTLTSVKRAAHFRLNTFNPL